MHNGDVYEGDFVENEFSGEGTYLFASGDKYVGQFCNGRYNGLGIYWILLMIDCDSLVVVNFDILLLGTFSYVNGTIESGVFENDVLQLNIDGDLAKELFTAASNGDLETVRRIVTVNTKLVNAKYARTGID